MYSAPEISIRIYCSTRFFIKTFCYNLDEQIEPYLQRIDDIDKAVEELQTTVEALDIYTQRLGDNRRIERAKVELKRL